MIVFLTRNSHINGTQTVCKVICPCYRFLCTKNSLQTVNKSYIMVHTNKKKFFHKMNRNGNLLVINEAPVNIDLVSKCEWLGQWQNFNVQRRRTQNGKILSKAKKKRIIILYDHEKSRKYNHHSVLIRTTLAS